MNNYKNKNFFFVGAIADGKDCTSDFMENNKWKLGWEGREEEKQYQVMKSYYTQMTEGDYIILKSSYTRKNDLPFPNPNNISTSVMRIKAVGVIKENIEDGHNIKVDWIEDYRTMNKEWYFYTSRVSIWMLDYKTEQNSQLIEFALNNDEQDYSYFLSIDHWKNQFFNNEQFEEYKLLQEKNNLSQNLVDVVLSEYANKLLSSKNIILRGAPGTGKTYLARSIAAEIVSEGKSTSFDELEDYQKKNIEFIQFHPSYDYTDFVEGFRPVVDKETNEMRYEVIPGVFKKFMFRAILKQKDEEKFVFVIDEINRGEISKIFGELFFALDPTYRGKQGSVKTQYSSINDVNNTLYVPENVYIIGTMNDIDRSVESFDFAMRRRFRFIEVTANSQITMLEGRVDDYEKAVNYMQRLNNAISGVEGLNSHYHIGPSYFLKLIDIDNNYDLLWQDYLEPLLEEYVRGFFDEVSILSELKNAYYGSYPENEYEN